MSEDRLPQPPDHAAPLHAVRPALPPHPDDAAGFARVLRRRDFRFLWGAQCGSQLAQNFIQFALLVVVYDLTGLTTAVAAVAVAFTFPGVLLSAPAGVYADRHDKRSLMMLTNLLRAGLLVLIPVTQLIPFLQHQAWPLLIITFLFSSVGQVFAPAEAASIPSLVSREQIQGAMSLFMTTVIFTLLLGSVLAPICLILFGDLVPFYIAAGLFALAALSCWRIGASLRAVATGAGPQTHVFQEFQDGARHPPPGPGAALGDDPARAGADHGLHHLRAGRALPAEGAPPLAERHLHRAGPGHGRAGGDGGGPRPASHQAPAALADASSPSSPPDPAWWRWASSPPSSRTSASPGCSSPPWWSWLSSSVVRWARS